MTDIGLGMRLKGTGSVPPWSKYENQSFVLANFHSTSASSCTNREETVIRGKSQHFEETFDEQ